MQRAFILVVAMIASTSVCFAQVSGNIAYSQAGGKARAEQNERSKRALVPGEMPPTGTSMFIEASVLMNVQADAYVAVFGVSQESSTVAECHQKMDATIQGFSAALKQLGIRSHDVFVDFVAQNKIYGYELEGNIAKEKIAGFELKKNISVRFNDKRMLDPLVLAASRSAIFDLVKVHYVVKDISKVQDWLMDEAARVVKQKAARYGKLLGIQLQPPAQVCAEKPSIYFPTEMYDSYIASESEGIRADTVKQKYMIQSARKSRTFFFNPLDAAGFDSVINPVMTEPVVQFTLYLKVKYEIEHVKRK